jgi:hypothetical protein
MVTTRRFDQRSWEILFSVATFGPATESKRTLRQAQLLAHANPTLNTPKRSVEPLGDTSASANIA